MASNDPEQHSGAAATAAAAAADAGVEVDNSVIDLLLGELAGEGGKPERVDTHGAVVLLGRKTAFKIKRRKRFPYMDFSTLPLRARALAAEVRLNRRTAPDVYKGLRPVIDTGAAFVLGPLQDAVTGDEPDYSPPGCVDWVLVMQRFDGSRLLSTLAEKGWLSTTLARDLADRVHAFHHAVPAAPPEQAGSMQAVMEDSCKELSGRDALNEDKRRKLTSLSRQWWEMVAPVLEKRALDGFVRHCHGDLHLGNVVATDNGPMLFDALEFDLALATIDIAYDSAFLTMDMDRFGLSEAGNAFFNRLLDLSADYGSLQVLPLFLSMRAAIRAKIAVSQAEIEDDSVRAQSALTQAADYLDRAVGYLQPPAPVVVAIGGLSGTGKTTVSRAIAPALGPRPGAVVVRSDAIRKRMAGVAETDTLDPKWYAPEIGDKVYDEMAAIAGRVVRAGHSVILDAVAARPQERALFEKVAGDARFTGIWLSADADLIRTRVADRRGDASDATTDVVDRQLEYDLGALSWTVTPSGGRLADVADRVLSVVTAAGS